MRRKAVCLLVFCAGSLALAATFDRRPRHDAGAPARAQAYAQQLTLVVLEIVQTYVPPSAPDRPPAPGPSSKELVRAGLEGLYEAAGVPLPVAVAERLRKAPSDDDVLAAVAAARLDLGDPASLRDKDALLVSVRAMSRLLDSHSSVLTEAEVRRINHPDAGQGVGLDATEAPAGGLVVTAVVPGGPAQRAGIRPGDRISHVNGEAADDMRWAAALAHLNTDPLLTGTTGGPRFLHLVLRRPERDKAWAVRLEPAAFRPETVLGVVRRPDNSWDYWADRKHKLAHVRLAGLARGPSDDPGRGTARELEEVLTALSAEGLRGLLLDLRWCPGGLLDQSIEVARLFLSKGVVATLEERAETKTSEATGDGLTGFPMVVLVNGETSGGAELIAAALQDNRRAVVAGQRTVGKASVQTTLELPANGTCLKLTNGTFFRPNGKNLHSFPDSKPTDDWGVRPEPRLELRLSPDASARLKEDWLRQTLRPGDAREALPLDDPDADPHRQAALEALRQMLK
jgi:C-terminal processing protease CtpA/Prc